MDTQTAEELRTELITLEKYGRDHSLFEKNKGFTWAVRRMNIAIAHLETDSTTVPVKEIKKNLIDIQKFGIEHDLYGKNVGFKYLIDGLQHPLEVLGAKPSQSKGLDFPKVKEEPEPKPSVPLPKPAATDPAPEAEDLPLEEIE